MKLIVLFLLTIAISATAERRSFQIKIDNRTIYVEGSFPIKKSNIWMVQLPGSTCLYQKPFYSTGREIHPDFDRINFLVINKEGSDPSSVRCDYNLFHKRFNMDDRISAIVKSLNKIIPASGEIILYGESEGAYLSPIVAKLDSRVKIVLNISGGTRSFVTVEIEKNKNKEFVKDFFENAVLGDFDYTKLLRNLPRDPSFCYLGEDCRTDKTFNFKTLNSYHNDRILNSLKEIDLPMLYLNGSEDKMVWINGLINDIDKLHNVYNKTKIKLQIFDGLNHQLRCRKSNCNDSLKDDVFPVMKKFFYNYLVSSSISQID